MRRTRGPYQPRHVLSPQDAAPFIAELGAGFAPGAGLADATGMYYSPVQGETVPGLLENVRGGQYGTAAFQGLGMLGDAMWLGGPVAGAVIGGALKAPGAIARAADATSTIRGYHGSPHDMPAERLVRMPDGQETFIVGTPNQLPEAPPGATVLQDYPMGRFRTDKIGTGEGAQAYGHGLYIGEAEGTARQYRDTLTPQSQEWQQAHERFMRAEVEHQRLSEVYMNQPTQQSLNDVIAAERNLAAAKVEADQLFNPGHMYEVNIHARPEQFLDWDAPLSAQPESVREALGNFALTTDIKDGMSLMPGARLRIVKDPDLPEYPRYFMEMDDGQKFRLQPSDLKNMIAQNLQEVHGKNIMSTIAAQVGGQEQASRALQETGIPGIRYLDQGSRSFTPPTIKKGPSGFELYWGNDPTPVDVFPTRQAAEEAAKQFDTRSRNYVIFDENLIEIMRKYGIAGLLGTGALTLGGATMTDEMY